MKRLGPGILLLLVLAGYSLTWEMNNYGKGPAIAGWSTLKMVTTNPAYPQFSLIIAAPLFLAVASLATVSDWVLLLYVIGMIDSVILFFMFCGSAAFQKFFWAHLPNGTLVIMLAFTGATIWEVILQIRRRKVDGDAT